MKFIGGLLVDFAILLFKIPVTIKIVLLGIIYGIVVFTAPFWTSVFVAVVGGIIVIPLTAIAYGLDEGEPRSLFALAIYMLITVIAFIF